MRMAGSRGWQGAEDKGIRVSRESRREEAGRVRRTGEALSIGVRGDEPVREGQ